MAAFNKTPFRWLVLAVLCSCTTAPKGLSDTIASSATPTTTRLSEHCDRQDIRELEALLSLMPPWDEEHNETRFSLATRMAEQPTQGCQEDAWDIFSELARAFPYTALGIKALRESCLLGLRLGIVQHKLDAVFSIYPNRDAALLEIVRNSPREEAQALLTAYGGTRSGELMNMYEKYRASTKP